jgi:phage shock protein C
MSGKHTKFYLDKQNAKWKGVCAGIADYTGVMFSGFAWAP